MCKDLRNNLRVLMIHHMITDNLHSTNTAWSGAAAMWRLIVVTFACWEHV